MDVPPRATGTASGLAGAARAAQLAGPPGVLFDQRSRYASLARAIEAMLPDGGTVLDVGCGEAMLLRQFLPSHRVTCLDPLLAGRDCAEVIGRPFADGVVPPQSFDAVVCVDVLEHVPADERSAFLARMIAASRRGIVLSAPFADAGEPRVVDDHVQIAYHHKTGRSYPWLEEHERFGLPKLDETLAALRAAGLHPTCAGNGHVPWLEDLLGLHIALLDRHEHLPLLQRIGDRFADLLAFDHLPPVYRHVVVAARGAPVTLPEQDAGPAVQAAARKAWGEFRSWVDAELGAHADALVQQAQAARAAIADDAEREAALRRQLDALLAERGRWDARAAEMAEALRSLQASRSWRLTAPLRALDRAGRRTLRACAHALLRVAYAIQKVLPAPFVGAAKRVFFTVGGPLLKHTAEYREYQQFRANRRPRAQRRRSASPPLAVAPGDPRRPDIVVFGIIGWHFRTQRPQHLALELARRGHRVFHLGPNLVEDSQPGYTIEPVATDLPVHEVQLHVARLVSIYQGSPGGTAHAQLAASLRMLLRDVRLGTAIALVDHPGWTALAALLPRSVVVYDCMDNHHGFATAHSQLAVDERRLVALADAVIVTSDHLETEMRRVHPRVSMVRNACDPERFAAARKTAPSPRPVIGYFGAIAEWFDVDLLREVAAAMPDCDFVMVGADTAGAQDRLRGASNVRWTGEVSYAELPARIAAFDAVFVPFVIDPLTIATNPVKAYEALAAGKPVVATPMPELMRAELAPFVQVAADARGCTAALRTALQQACVPERMAERIAFASRQTWSARADELLAAIAAIPRPRVGVVVVSWNGVDLTRRCLRSVLDDPAAPELDVVIVDNASTDGTAAWLDEIAAEPRVRVIRNAENRGFAAACNQGLEAAAAAGADVLVILNNDIVVTPGWARTLATHLRRDPSIGLIGPVTNNIGNEARIHTHYRDLAAMLDEQAALTGAMAGETFEIPVLAFFCVAMPRDVHERVGELDTGFGTGFFEDDDYCQRVRRLGRRIVCAEDVFVHHELSASFGKVDPEEKKQLFERNRRYYESKWGPWQPHSYRRERQPAWPAAE